jgi:hypothetical protein
MDTLTRDDLFDGDKNLTDFRVPDLRGRHPAHTPSVDDVLFGRSPRHHVETFAEDLEFGWQCFDCEAEQVGYPTFNAAQAGGIAHESHPNDDRRRQ